MWTVLWYVLGTLRLKITGAEPAWALERLAEAKVAFRDVRRVDDYTVCLTVLRRDEKRAYFAARRAMCEVQTVNKSGLPSAFLWVKRRPLFFFGLILCLIAAVFVPKFVFFYEIVGNDRVPEAQIRRELEALGVGFGTFGPDIQPQEIKNHILVRIPELQWITVQQSGMCARVVVRERPEKEPIYDKKTLTEVIASESGVITSVSCLSGNCLCRVGQAVGRGDVLVSPYTDLGFKTQVSPASAEIYAETVHRTETVLPEKTLQKQSNGRTHHKLCLFAGGRRWTLWGAPWQGSCDMETKRLQFSLPGGFFFPIGIEITTVSEYDSTEKDINADEAEPRLLEAAVGSVRRSLLAGTVRQIRHTLTEEGGRWTLRSRIECEEMIARMVPVQILKDDDE